jgi:hypothetical protein
VKRQFFTAGARNDAGRHFNRLQQRMRIIIFSDFSDSKSELSGRSFRRARRCMNKFGRRSVGSEACPANSTGEKFNPIFAPYF